ncbi:MAG: DUF1501 domain-containing protein [Planctomycetota bacterium]|nr:DUF1501 domain-containing protein [Planctomycetota bacterium]MDA1214436.1 DUF1501 domain-containing protein [Planctomycetota bacterium]
MLCNYSCGSNEHVMARRQFLSQMMAGTAALGGLSLFSQPGATAQLNSDQKRIVVFNMHGGLSQLESWDPKPGTNTGGPFRAIPTSVPGVHICELLPMTAQQMHHLSIVRSVNTAENDHGKGAYMMLTGRRQTPASNFPVLGAVAAKALTPSDSPLPGHIVIGGGNGNSAYLGPKYSSVSLNGNPPPNIERLSSVELQADLARQEMRRKLNERFRSQRRSALTDAYTYSFEQAQQLMERKDIFDVSKEPASEHERYGTHDFGKHCLLARRLLENGISFVQVSHSNYDTHNENFDFHLEQLGEVDRSFSTFVADLANRGMLESTLIVMLSEFGRTPNINVHYGRDHWGTAWSVLLGGCGIQQGAVIGKTNDNGTAVVDRQVDHGHLFHTYLKAVGLNSSGSFDIGGREVPLADPAYSPIEELLV